MENWNWIEVALVSLNWVVFTIQMQIFNAYLLGLTNEAGDKILVNKGGFQKNPKGGGICQIAGHQKVTHPIFAIRGHCPQNSSFFK